VRALLVDARCTARSPAIRIAWCDALTALGPKNAIYTFFRIFSKPDPLSLAFSFAISHANETFSRETFGRHGVQWHPEWKFAADP
jgi:hypothetical protein